MEVLAKRFVIEKEKGNEKSGKTIEIRDAYTGHAYVLDQYPSWERHRKGAASWAVAEKYGEFLGKFRTKKGALNYLTKLKKVI
jgi:hypothetical protein